MFYCYILRCADGSFYTGVADDPERRCAEHNQGKGAEWTARRRPVEVVWTEIHETLSSARTRENQLKRWSHTFKVASIWHENELLATPIQTSRFRRGCDHEIRIESPPSR
jgi:putative endonuclease